MAFRSTLLREQIVKVNEDRKHSPAVLYWSLDGCRFSDGKGNELDKGRMTIHEAVKFCYMNNARCQVRKGELPVAGQPHVYSP